MVPGGTDGMKFYNTSMASLASFLSSMANGGRPVQDKTGLAARYDITLKLGAADADAEESARINDRFGVEQSRFEAGILRREGQAEALVIDHIERPSEN